MQSRSRDARCCDAGEISQQFQALSERWQRAEAVDIVEGFLLGCMHRDGDPVESGANHALDYRRARRGQSRNELDVSAGGLGCRDGLLEPGVMRRSSPE